MGRSQFSAAPEVYGTGATRADREGPATVVGSGRPPSRCSRSRWVVPHPDGCGTTRPASAKLGLGYFRTVLFDGRQRYFDAVMFTVP